MPLPTVSPEQPSAETNAADSGNTGTNTVETVLRARQELLDHVTAGEDSIPSVLARAGTDPVVATTKVSQLVQALPGYGPGKAVGALKRAGIAVDRRVEGLEPGQHKALLEALA